jgi:hypothetical protein
MRRILIYGTALAVSLGVVVLAASEDHSDDYEPADASLLADETVVTCEIDLDDHPTRDEVIAILGEPVDVDHFEGEDNLDGSEWLPAEDTLVWANGNQVSFDADTNRASSWMMDDPRIC